MVATVHAAACQSLDWPIRAVASRDTGRASDLARTVGARSCSFDDVIAQRRGDIAIVATPPASHVGDAILHRPPQPESGVVFVALETH